MQKNESLWVSSCLGNLLILPTPSLSCFLSVSSRQPLWGRVGTEGGREEYLSWGWLPHFLGPSNISWGCRRHFPLCQEPEFREAESGQRDHKWRRALAATWWGLFWRPREWKWLWLPPGKETGHKGSFGNWELHHFCRRGGFLRRLRRCV